MGLLPAICELSEIEPPVSLVGERTVAAAAVRAAALEAALCILQHGKRGQGTVVTGNPSR